MWGMLFMFAWSSGTFNLQPVFRPVNDFFFEPPPTEPAPLHHEVGSAPDFHAALPIARQLMADGREGSWTTYQPTGEVMRIYDASVRYQEAGTPLVILGGKEYGTGSSRDWAAKGTQLLGVKAVVAKSFERIHRSNLVGMGVLPLQFKGSDSVESLGIRGDETFEITGLSNLRPQQDVTLVIVRPDGGRREAKVLCRIDTPIEIDYFQHGGILPYVLRELVSKAAV